MLQVGFGKEMKQRWHGEINVAVALALAVMLGVALLPLPAHADPDPGWYDASWAYRKQITVDHSKVISALSYDAQTADFTEGDTITGGTSGATATIESDDDEGTSGTLYVYNVSGTFQDNETITDEHTGSASVDGTLSTPSNFPVLVHIDSSETDFWNHCSSESEVVFTQSDGTTKLKREVEEFDHTDDDLFAWVKTSLSSSTDTVLYMYYGNASASETDDADTWDFNHKGVWHLNETFGTHYDATTNSNDGAPNGGLNQDATGKIGGADDFDGTDDAVISPTSASLDITSAVTIEAWIYSTDFKNQYPGIVTKWDWSGTNPQRSYSLYLMDWTKPCVMVSSNGSYQDQLVSTTQLATNTWYYLTGLFTGPKYIIYINGAWNCEMDVTKTIHSGTAKLSIGSSMQDGSVATDETFKGTIDEVRVSDIARSADWIKTCYNNQNSPSTFYSVGSEETIGQTWYLSSETMWWNPNYLYRQQLTVSTGSSAVTSGYSVKTTIDTATLETAGKVRSDRKDWRIVYWNGSTNVELDRYYAGTAETWFKLQAAIAANSSDGNYYAYYGYAGESGSPLADPDNVFLFYDDFEDGTLTKWTVETGWGISTDQAHNSTYSMKHVQVVGQELWARANGVDEANVYLTSWWYMTGDSDITQDLRVWTGPITDPSNAYEVNMESTGYLHCKLVNGSWTGIGSKLGSREDNVWVKITTIIRGTTTHYGQMYYNDTQLLPDGVGGWQNMGTDHASGSVGFRTYNVPSGGWYIDDVIARKFVDPEPTVSAGSEQTSSYIMYKADTSKPDSTVTVSAGGSDIWRANQTAQVDVPFPAGTWTGTITLNTAFPAGQNFTVEVGTHDTSFTSYGSQTFTGDGTATSFSLEISASAFTVLENKYLALRISNSSASADLIVKTGQSNSYLTSPASDPGYPVPELPTIILLGAGLACLGGYVYFMRRKRRSVSP